MGAGLRDRPTTLRGLIHSPLPAKDWRTPQPAPFSFYFPSNFLTSPRVCIIRAGMEYLADRWYKFTQWGVGDWIEVFLLAIPVFLIISLLYFRRRWGYTTEDKNRFKQILNIAEEFYFASLDWTPQQWENDRQRNVDRFWTGRPSERRRLFSQTGTDPFPEAVVGFLLTGRSPFHIYRVMRIWFRENHARWRIIVNRENPP